MILKRNYKKILFTAFFSITIFSIYCISYASEPTVSSLEYYDYDFEEVELTTTKTATVSITNSSSNEKSVFLYTVAFENGSYFELKTQIPWYGIEVPPGETVGVEIAFTPEIVGSVTDTLNIWTEKPAPGIQEPSPTLAVELSGTGISKTNITINEILDFFDSSVDSGSLIGNNGGNEADDLLLAYAQKKKQNGNEGKSAENKLFAFRNQLRSTGKLIESEDLDGACRQLTSISNKCDGKDRPPDFVLGAAYPDPVPQLNNMIMMLSESLNCE
jgi:hypothetical protein